MRTLAVFVVLSIGALSPVKANDGVIVHKCEGVDDLVKLSSNIIADKNREIRLKIPAGGWATANDDKALIAGFSEVDFIYQKSEGASRARLNKLISIMYRTWGDGFQATYVDKNKLCIVADGVWVKAKGLVKNDYEKYELPKDSESPKAIADSIFSIFSD